MVISLRFDFDITVEIVEFRYVGLILEEEFEFLLLYHQTNSAFVMRVSNSYKSEICLLSEIRHSGAHTWPNVQIKGGKCRK